ncbi:two-component response regulator ORR3 [Ziziphus jujuba]|uniref:Two-component response regulator ORR3 n=2 Tax=Ziziphus jujuba TaxID=326968 RepID=A0A6P3Z9C1_ZIZJJ|nr:two-component response regulator ORR3 [Ziziphus jujuba]KAH7519750.1 hypothetical protein FEM48_Zijuj08G0070300 [Ziziphus jujuba var. spinosa]
MADLSAPPDHNVSPIHILVVDDCWLDRKIVQKVLQTSFFKVTTVESGEKAMEVLGLNEENVKHSTSVNDLNIDMILTDYCMPGMNGHDLLVAIKENSHSKSIPVVIMSSEYNASRISRCLTDGAQEFIQKPLKIKDVQRLRSYVNPAAPTTKTGAKIKVLIDQMPESKEAERRPPPLAGVAVA